MPPRMSDVELIRQEYRPERITTLFVGESAPHSGKFFYSGNTAMLANMRGAVEAALGEEGDFLQRFKSFGWYLDDLVLTPVDHLARSERETACAKALQSLADRIRSYSPTAIVSLLRRITPMVEAAASMARHTGPVYSVPFPGMGQQARFYLEMQRIVPLLPRL